MANKWQYPRWRRATMQATMWLVFGATLAAAAMVSKHRKFGGHVPLGEERNGMRMPVGWLWQGRDPNDPTVIGRVIEPRPDGYGRSVTVQRFQTRRPESALTFLHSQGLPTDLVAPDAEASGVREPPQRVIIGGAEGVITGGPDPNPNLPRRRYYATAALPQRTILFVMLDGLGPVEPDDLDMLARVAGSVTVNERPTVTRAPRVTQSNATPPVATSGVLSLPGGANVAVPAGYAPVAEDDADALRTGRTLVSPAARVELVPCVLASNDTDTDRATLAELHEPEFHGAIVQELPTAPDANGDARFRQWSITPPPAARDANAGKALPVGAYLIADRSTGAAVLAVFRAEPRQQVAFDEAWQAIASGVSFEKIGPVDVPSLLTAGERAATAVTAGGVRKLVTAASGGEDSGDARQWWLMFGDAPADQLAGWSSQRVSVSPTGWSGVRQVRMRQHDAGGAADPSSAITRSLRPVVDEWGDNNTMTGYWRITATPMAQPGTAPKQLVKVNGKQLVIESTRRGLARRDARPLPKNFIPGPWLQMALGGLANDAGLKPMLVKTDAFPGCEPTLARGLLSLLIEPDPDAVATQPASEDDPPLRCLRVTINGSGEFARWYFTPDGRPAKVNLAGGMHRRVTDEAEVRYNFRDDPGMKPDEVK